MKWPTIWTAVTSHGMLVVGICWCRGWTWRKLLWCPLTSDEPPTTSSDKYRYKQKWGNNVAIQMIEITYCCTATEQRNRIVQISVHRNNDVELHTRTVMHTFNVIILVYKLITCSVLYCISFHHTTCFFTRLLTQDQETICDVYYID